MALRTQKHSERRHRTSRLRSSRIRETDDPFNNVNAPFEDVDAPFDDDEVESETSLKERIRTGGLRPILELGVTPSHISMLLEGEEERMWRLRGVEGGT